MGKLRAYFDLSNRVSNVFLVLPAYLLFYIGLVLRFTLKDPNSFAYARYIYHMIILIFKVSMYVTCFP